MKHEARNSTDRSVTMEDVAERAGVSRALVSIVFRGVPGASDESRARVMKAAEELSYRPDQRARLLGRKRSQTIGVSFRLHDEAHAGFVDDLYNEADKAGYHIVISPVTSHRPEQLAWESLLDYRCEAAIVIGPSSSGARLDAIVEHMRTIVVGRRVSNRHCSTVRNDDALGAQLATQHLIELGHRRIAHVHGGRAAGAKERLSGYRKTMTDADLARSTRVVPGGLTEDDGARAADELLEHGLPTAIYVYNDQCAAGLIARLRERGVRIPHDISVVGNDNSRLANSVSLQLTTIAQHLDEIARHALELAIARRPAYQPTEIVVAPHLIARDTTAPIWDGGSLASDQQPA